MARAQEAHGVRARKCFSKRMSDHVAFALVVYTMTLIFLTSGAIHFGDMSIIPYFLLVVFVACAIPYCKSLERKWAAVEAADPGNDSYNGEFNADRAKLWIGAFLVPTILWAFFKLIVG